MALLKLSLPWGETGGAHSSATWGDFWEGQCVMCTPHCWLPRSLVIWRRKRISEKPLIGTMSWQKDSNKQHCHAGSLLCGSHDLVASPFQPLSLCAQTKISVGYILEHVSQCLALWRHLDTHSRVFRYFTLSYSEPYMSENVLIGSFL